MKFYDGFIGEDRASSTLEFSGGDNEDMFLENLKTQDADWYYRNAKIYYKFNSFGHRSVEIENLDFDNYFLVAGCSHTQGVGLELEKTYPYLLSEKLKIDYYNLGIGASGLDVMEHNLLLWFHRFKKKPKFVLLQWPDVSRYGSCIQADGSHIIPMGAWQDDTVNKKFIIKGLENGMFFARKKLAYKLIMETITCPIINLSYSNQLGYDNDALHFKKVDVARDLSHLGMKSQLLITSALIEQPALQPFIK